MLEGQKEIQLLMEQTKAMSLMNQELAKQTNLQQMKGKEKKKMRTQQGFFSQKDREMALEPTTGTDFVSGIDKKAMPFKKQFLSEQQAFNLKEIVQKTKAKYAEMKKNQVNFTSSICFDEYNASSNRLIQKFLSEVSQDNFVLANTLITQKQN